jgi:hypothetical protein
MWRVTVVQTGVHQAEVERVVIEGQSLGILESPTVGSELVLSWARIDVRDDDVLKAALLKDRFVGLTTAND